MQACCYLGNREFNFVRFQVKVSHDSDEKGHISELKKYRQYSTLSPIKQQFKALYGFFISFYACIKST